MPNASVSKSGVVRPTGETGSSGVRAECPTASANGRFFWNSFWTSASSSGNSKSLPQSPGSHGSSGSSFAAVVQVAISGVIDRAP